MITPSVKTNLILKEMGITRYELRSKQEPEPSKIIFSYQKGNILTLLGQSYDDLDEDEAKLLIAILDAVKPVDKNIVQNKYNLDDIKENISAIKEFSLYLFLLIKNPSSDQFIFYLYFLNIL